MSGKHLAAKQSSAGDVRSLEYREREKDIIKTVNKGQEFGFWNWILELGKCRRVAARKR